ncbi:acid protease [Sarocladium strictum]
MTVKSPLRRGLSLLIPIALALLPLTEAQVVQWEIYRRNDGSQVHRRAERTYEETIVNERGRGGYFATARLGTPGQNVTLQLDTASSDIWIPYSGASICRTKSSSGRSGCYLGSFDPDKSKTFYDFAPDSFDISYIDQSYAKGDYFNDTFEITGATVTNLTMGLGLQTDLAYGLLGVGYAINEASISSAGFMYPNLPIAMQKSGHIRTIAYSLWLNDLDASTGNILFGGVDKGKYLGDMMRISILKDKRVDNYTHFAIPMTSLEATSPTGTDVLSTKWPIEVILDSGTTLSYLPFGLAQSVWDEVGATYNSKLEMAVLPCSHGAHPGYFSFGFAGPDGPRINITMDELVIDLTDGNPPEFTSGEYKGERVCQFGIQRSYASPWTLGDTFLRSAYVVYDLENNEIGMASTDFNSTKTNVLPFKSKGAKIPSATLVTNEMQSSGSPAPAGTNLIAANGFQDKDENGNDLNNNQDNNNGEKDGDDDDDAACVPHPLSGPGFWTLGAVLAYMMCDHLVIS